MLGKMNTSISIVSKTITTDTEGFQTATDTTLGTMNAYIENRHGSTAWANRAAFTDATDLFVIRVPSFDVDTSQFIIMDGKQWKITSVENTSGRGMYLKILGKLVVPSGED